MIIIEHLEDILSPWLYYEYKHSAEIYPDLIITNLKNKLERVLMAEHSSSVSISVREIPFQKVIVLDPMAEKPLVPEDFDGSVVVVGGILGDHPPKGRTKELLSSKLNCEIRHLGEKQLSIDSAVYVAYSIKNGKRLEEIEFVDGIEIEIGGGRTMELPYRYPVKNGKVTISDELVRYIKEELDMDDSHALRTGKPVSIVDKFRKRLSLR